MSEDLKKSADALVEETLATLGVEEASAEETVTTELVKSENAPEDKKNDEDDSDEDKKKKKKDGDKDDKKEGDDKKPAFMKSEPSVIRKSMEELATILTEDELTVIGAWREELDSPEVEVQVEETIVKSQVADESADLVKSLTAKFEVELTDIRKALNDKDDLIKSLTDKIEVLAAQPAHDPKAITDLAIVEAPAPAPTLTKSFVLSKMQDLHKSGAGVDSRHITEFEVSGKISNPHVRELVSNACKNS